MPQKRIEISHIAPQRLFGAEIKRFIKRWPTSTLTADDLEALQLIAIDARFLNLSAGNGNPALVECFRREPDFTLAFLQFIRRCWRKLDKSKFGRLKKFFATVAQLEPKQGPTQKTDKQWTSIYEKWSLWKYSKMETVNEQLVTKARKWVAARV